MSPEAGMKAATTRSIPNIMTYNLWIPTDFLKFVDVEISFFNPVTEKTTTYAIESNDENMFGAEGY